jgi:ribosomal protein L39E
MLTLEEANYAPVFIADGFEMAVIARKPDFPCPAGRKSPPAKKKKVNERLPAYLYASKCKKIRHMKRLTFPC